MSKIFVSIPFIIFVTVLLTIGMIWWQTYQRSVEYYEKGERYFQNGQYVEAINSYEISAHAYAPGNTYVRRSLEKLWQIGQMYELEKKDVFHALVAYRSLRSSVYSIRSFYMPYKEWIPRCDQKIKELVEIQQHERKGSEEPLPEPTQTPPPTNVPEEM
ncbi:hypothetical protein JW979_04780 [bacterium]|nr:hypothetical protein [candidate division CSSED10-310 bacterium]